MIIDIVLVTWPNHPRRLEYLRCVWESIQANMTSPRHTIRWLCSSESERDTLCQWCGDELETFCRERKILLRWRNGKASLGAGMNFAVSLCSSPVYVVWQDDYRLDKPFDLSAAADFMLAHTEVALFRIGYFTDPKNGTTFSGEIAPGYRQVNIDASWPYGDEPHMRRKDFVSRWGKYVEGGRHGHAESDMLFRLVKARAIIAAGPHSHCNHIGQIAAVPEPQEYRERAIKRSDAS